MILRCNYEELAALRRGARAVLDSGRGGRGAVAAPPEGRHEVEALLPRLVGDLTVDTLLEQQRLTRAVMTIVDELRETMEVAILAAHPADESAVSAYFDFAHALAVLGRLTEMGAEMEALIELVTGAPPTPDVARTFRFPH